MHFLYRDLGFSNLVPLLSLLFATILAFVVRRKWRIAAARKEEIMRLLVLAAEEAATAELEAAAEYGATAGAAVAIQQCAVCYCPTTTRCSRCKAVRYCSGKCQIIHWRQGHKEECCPPPSGAHLNNTGSDSDQSDVENTSLEAEEDSHAKAIQESHKRPTTSESSCSSAVLDVRDDVKIMPHVDVTGDDSSNITLSNADCFTSTTPAEQLASGVHENPLSSSSSILRGPLSDDISHDTPRSKTDVVPHKSKSQTSECPAPAVAAVNTFSSSNKLKQKTPSKSNKTFDYESSSSSFSSSTSSDECSVVAPSSPECPNATLGSGGAQSAAHGDFTQSSFRDGGDTAQSDSGFRFSFNLSHQSVPSVLSTCSSPKTLVSDSAHHTSPGGGVPRGSPSGNLVTENPPTLGSERPPSITKERNGDKRLLKSSGPMPLSYGASAERVSSGARCSTSTVTSKVDSVRTVPVSCEATNSTPNGSNSLKTSMRKVVQQFKPSKLSKHHPLGFGSEIADKYKMLFPYDLFIKLYNSEKVELRPTGLTNCGNSCYANAVLQCLTFTRPLTNYLLQGYHSKSCPKKEWCFTCELESLVLQTKEGKSPISPIGILSQIQSIGSHLGHGSEEDAHEFLRYAIDTMQSVCLKQAGLNAEAPLAEETTLIQLIFGGYLRSKIQCMKCQGKSERQERMMDLTVEIHGDIGTLEEALERFTATEILDGDNKYHCDRCKSYEKAKKRLTVLEAPNILTIALKRFQSGKFGKINKSVRFPEFLNLAPYMRGTGDKSPIYRLYAVVVHLDIMNAAFSGHYVCYVKNPQGKWFKMDDSKAKPVELDRVLTKTAYMLLYARCSPRAPSAMRNAVPLVHIKSKRSKWTEAIPSSHSERSTSKERPTPSVSSSSSAGFSEALPRPAVYPYWMPADRPTNFDSADSLDGSVFSYRSPKRDSSSDNSSLLSCSDEGSCSTESTRDSTSADEYSEYIFGDWGSFGSNSPSPLSASEDLDVSYLPALSRSLPSSAFKTVHVSTSPEQSKERREVSLGTKSSRFLYSDASRQSRKLTDHSSSSGADWEPLGRFNPADPKSGGVSLRRPWEKATQTFYC